MDLVTRFDAVERVMVLPEVAQEPLLKYSTKSVRRNPPCTPEPWARARGTDEASFLAKIQAEKEAKIEVLKAAQLEISWPTSIKAPTIVQAEASRIAGLPDHTNRRGRGQPITIQLNRPGHSIAIMREDDEDDVCTYLPSLFVFQAHRQSNVGIAPRRCLRRNRHLSLAMLTFLLKDEAQLYECNLWVADTRRSPASYLRDKVRERVSTSKRYHDRPPNTRSGQGAATRSTVPGSAGQMGTPNDPNDWRNRFRALECRVDQIVEESKEVRKNKDVSTGGSERSPSIAWSRRTRRSSTGSYVPPSTVSSRFTGPHKSSQNLGDYGAQLALRSILDSLDATQQEFEDRPRMIGLSGPARLEAQRDREERTEHYENLRRRILHEISVS